MKHIRTFLHGNIGKLIAINFLIGFVLWYGIEKTFLREAFDVGAQGVAAIAITYIVVSLIFDVPSGVLADKWSRKYMIVVAASLFLLADIILGLATSFEVYLLATVIWGLFTVSMSGTYESITYDSLFEEGRSDQYQRVDAVQRSAFMVGIFISSASGGFIGEAFGLRSTFFLSAIPLAIAILLAFRLSEPKKHQELTQTNFLGHTKSAFSSVFSNKTTTVIALLMVAVLILQNLLYEYSQYFFLYAFDSSLTLTAIANGATGLLLGIGYLIASRVKRYGMFLSVSGVFMLIATFWQGVWAIVPFALVYIFLAILQNLTQTSLQHSLPSVIRTASTSAVNFIGNIFIIPIAIVFAWSIDTYGVEIAYRYVGAVFMLIGLPFITLMYKKRSNKMPPVASVDEFTVK